MIILRELDEALSRALTVNLEEAEPDAIARAEELDEEFPACLVLDGLNLVSQSCTREGRLIAICA